MANRSYLIRTSYDSTITQRKEDDKVIGVSEYDYSIPLSYKILVSQNSKLVNTIIFGYVNPIAIQGDFLAGRIKLYEFLDKLLNLNLFDAEKLNKYVSKTKEFLDNNVGELNFIVLECGEIFDMDDEEIEIQNSKLFEEDVLNIDEQIEEYINDFKEINNVIGRLEIRLENLTSSSQEEEILKVQIQDRIKELHLQKWEYLGIDNWSEVLYYDLNYEIDK